MNRKLIEKAKSCTSKDELIKLAEEEGYKLDVKEAENYYNYFHKEGLMSDEELDNVAGGACYSTNSHHYLITTWGNTCDGYVVDPEYDTLMFNDGSCFHCTYSFADGLVTYCRLRTKENDPYR